MITGVHIWKRVEAGFGVHLLEAASLGEKHFGTFSQFGDHMGFEYRFGALVEIDISYRYQHLSNTGIKLLISSLDSSLVRLQNWNRWLCISGCGTVFAAKIAVPAKFSS